MSDQPSAGFDLALWRLSEQAEKITRLQSALRDAHEQRDAALEQARRFERVAATSDMLYRQAASYHANVYDVLIRYCGKDAVANHPIPDGQSLGQSLTTLLGERAEKVEAECAVLRRQIAEQGTAAPMWKPEW